MSSRRAGQYTDSGTGLNVYAFEGVTPHLIMMHGWGQSLESLLPLAKLLHAKLGISIRLLDLPGFGSSKAPPAEGWTTAQYAERILAYLDAEDICQPDLLGHSFGCRVAMRMAAASPERVGRLILVSPAGLKRKRQLSYRAKTQWIKILRLVENVTPGGLSGRVRDWRIDRYASDDYKAAGEMRTTLVKTVNEDLSGVAAEISASTLLLWGEQDAAITREMVNRLHSLIRNSELVEMPGRDHFPFKDSPDLCAYHIVRFLREAPEEARS